MTLSRRHVLKRVLTTGVYVTPVVLSLSTAIEPAAVTPPGAIGGTMPASVTFLPLRVQYTGQGSGFPPNQAYLFLLAGPDGSVLSQSVIRTDVTGATTITVNPGLPHDRWAHCASDGQWRLCVRVPGRYEWQYRYVSNDNT